MESDGTNRNLTLRCSLVGGSSTVLLCCACSSESAENKGWKKGVLLTHPPPWPLLLKHPLHGHPPPQFSRHATFRQAFTVPAAGCKPEHRLLHQAHALSTRICILLAFNVRPLHRNDFLLCSCASWHLNSYLVPELVESRVLSLYCQSKIIKKEDTPLCPVHTSLRDPVI